MTLGVENRLLAEIERLQLVLKKILRELNDPMAALQGLAKVSIRQSEELMPDNNDLRVRRLLYALDQICHAPDKEFVRKTAAEALGVPMRRRSDMQPLDEDGPTQPQMQIVHPPSPLPLHLRALEIAAEMDGHGETIGDNLGPAIDNWRLAVAPKDFGKPRSWCGVAASFTFFEAARRANETLPFALSSGARRLVLNVGEYGQFLENPVPGALMLFYRNSLGRLDWRRHVETCISWQLGEPLITWSWNHGPFPSVVHPRRWGPEWRKSIDLIAVPVKELTA